ncbi:MAG: type III pantothenate kinase [Phycisphaerae bacterium]
MKESGATDSTALLVIEIGNSHLAVAQFVDRNVKSLQRMTLDELGALPGVIGPMWEALPEEPGRAVVLGSVVPQATERVEAVVGQETGTAAHVVGRDLSLPLALGTVDANTVGVDRVCAAAAAVQRFERNCAVASFGTATTIDCATATGEFLGGCILAGVGMQLAALHEQTAQLPLVQLHKPRQVFGHTTPEAINNGVLFGAAGALRDVVERYATELGRWPHLVLTGGFASLVAEVCDFVDAIVPDLCVAGLALAYEKAAASGEVT